MYDSITPPEGSGLPVLVSLRGGSKKDTCPDCRQKRFKPYVYNDSQEPVNPDLYGRCDRENSCGYHEHPNQDKDFSPAQNRKAKPQLPPTKTVYPTTEYIVNLARNQNTNLHKAFRRLGVTNQHFEKWGLGGDSYGNTAFIIKGKGKALNAQFVKYAKDGHREKSRNPWFMGGSYLINQGLINRDKKANWGDFYAFERTFYGSHAFDSNKPTCIVEAPKTALLAAFFFPAYNWLATFGSNGITSFDYFIKQFPKSYKLPVYYLPDNDDAGKKSKTRVNLAALEDARGHKGQFHTVQLFPDSEPGYDLADAIVYDNYRDILQLAKALPVGYRLDIADFVTDDKIFNYVRETYSSNLLSALTAQMGMAKTGAAFLEFYLQKKAGHTGKKIIALPNNLSMRQKVQEFSCKENNVYGIELDIIAYNGDMDYTDRQFLSAYDVVVVWYERLSEIELGPDDLVIVDEAHKITQKGKLFNQIMNGIEKAISCGAKVRFMTGTPDRELYRALGIFEHEVRATNPKHRHVNIVPLSKAGKVGYNTSQAGVLYMEQSVRWVKKHAKEADKVYPVFLNNKEHLRQVAKILGNKLYRIVICNKDQKEEEFFKRLADTGTIEKDGRPIVFLTTSVFAEASRLKEYVGRAAFFGQDHEENVAQFTGRSQITDAIITDWYIALQKAKSYTKSYEQFRAPAFEDYEREKPFWALAKIEVSKGHTFSFHGQKLSTEYYAAISHLFMPDGSFNELRCFADYKEERFRNSSLEQTSKRLEAFCSVALCDVVDIDISEEITEGHEAGKAAKALAEAEAFTLIRENLQYAVYFYSHSCKGKNRKAAKDLLELGNRALSESEEYREYRLRIKRNSHTADKLIKVMGSFVYLRSVGFTGDEQLINIIEAGKHRALKKNIDKLCLLTFPLTTPGQILDAQYLRGCIDAFKEERYTPKQIKKVIAGYLTKFSSIKEKNPTALFKQVFDWTPGNKGGRGYRIKGVKTWELLSEEYGLGYTFSYSIDNKEKCTTVLPDRAPF